MVLYRYVQKYGFQMKYLKKKNETKNLFLKYPEIWSYVSTIPWSYKKKIVNRPVLYIPGTTVNEKKNKKNIFVKIKSPKITSLCLYSCKEIKLLIPLKPLILRHGSNRISFFYMS